MAAPMLSPPSMAAPPAAPGNRMPGQAGTVRNPWLVLLLVLVTFGIYGLVWWWMVSGEVDRHLQRPHARPMVRLGLLLLLAGLVLYILSFVALFVGLAGGKATGAAALVWLLLIGLGACTMLAGVVLLYVGAWRIWSTLRAHEASLGAAKPLSPGAQLAMCIIPYVNLVTMWVAYYRTQNHLNAMWQGRLVE